MIKAFTWIIADIHQTNCSNNGQQIFCHKLLSQHLAALDGAFCAAHQYAISTLTCIFLHYRHQLVVYFVGLCAHPEPPILDFSKLTLTMPFGFFLLNSAAELWKNIGCSVTKGYGLSETAKVMTSDGYFKTGDIGLRMSKGCIKIVDRLKDMIIVSGFNVYPNEIEDALTKHSDVMEAAVIGKPDERTGERVCAFITCSADIDKEDVLNHCRKILTAYKIPKELNVIAELPKSTVGKILHRELR
ncbi:MAG: acyl-CoA synthetase (AMP-forming)/AMP-acid ligase II [Glaciecola sp.]|jgi:acyl-CoA synthetase (AMP-forming)/AMP-acid ligase II